MNITEKNIDQYLEKLKIKSLNAMQLAAIDTVKKNNEFILLSPTGSGKTLSFILPVLNSIDVENKHVQAIIMVPSRELALQIETVIKQMQTGFKITTCYGGHKREIEEKNLIQPPAIVIGTAGRMADHIRRNNFDTKSVKFLVLDEFDKSLELGFLEEMKYIIEALKNVEKKMLTSATNEVDIPAFVGLQNPTTLDFLPKEITKNESLRIHTVISDNIDKLQTLLQLICYCNNTSTIIFCNHRDAVERTSKFLHEQGIVNVFYHGGMEQLEREVALTKFRNTSSNILVTTDLASRGLDIENIRNIVHYHLPHTEAEFTHRNGRTARMDATGNVYVLWAEDEILPTYITDVATKFTLPERYELPTKPTWGTMFIDAGKKDKISKTDIVGYLIQVGQLKKVDIGLIEVKDFTSFAAIRKSKMSDVLLLTKDTKMKNKKIKFAIAK